MLVPWQVHALYFYSQEQSESRGSRLESGDETGANEGGSADPADGLWQRRELWAVQIFAHSPRT